MANTPVEPELQASVDGGRFERFALPTDEAFLEKLLTDIFENYWDRIVFGPIIQGGAFEFKFTNKPEKIVLFDGYLTVVTGNEGSHFHLCIGENKGSSKNPTPEALKKHRRTARAEFFRGLNTEGQPVNWGLQFFNGNGEQQMSIFMPSPFIADDGKILKKPDWPRLATWEALTKKYLNRDPDPKDRTAKKFAHT
ncbi:MAG: DUF7676 family protein [Rhodospirillales bacterium]